MSRYKAYAEYKDSETEWLGQIPSSWGVKRLGQFFEERREKVSDEDYPALSVTMQGIVPQLETAAKTDAGDNRKLVLKNDFVINSRSDRKGSSGVSSYDGSVSLISIVMTPREVHSPFAHHLLRSYPFQEEFYRYGKGIVADLWSTNASEMKNILIPDISLSEQVKIAAFLDYETAKIDDLIEKQQRLIELLKEKRQAAISHAVTKGLNPNAPMKDSGVEWLGEVPAHWEVPKLFYRTSKIGDGLHAAPQYEDGTGIYFINGNNLVDGKIVFGSTAREVPYVEYKNNYIELDETTVLLSINGTVGNAALYRKEKIILGKSAAYINCLDRLLPEYLILYLQSENSRRYYQQEVTGTTIYNLSLNSIRQIRICIPPKFEQAEIVEFCATQNSKYKALVGQANRAIDLMQERRTALISAAVTGKIDVRDWQPAAVRDEADIECCANLS